MEEKWEPGFKVVNKIKGKFWSATSLGFYSSTCMKGRIQYKVGKVTVPKRGKGPLAVFSTCIFAKEFYQSFGVGSPSLETILEMRFCKYVPSKREPGYNFSATGKVMAEKVILGKKVEENPGLPSKHKARYKTWLNHKIMPKVEVTE